MQNSDEKLTITEFANRAGCSPQRVSQLLRKSLKPFQVIENGRKYVLSGALPIVLEAREKQGYRKSFETVSETVSSPYETVSSQEEVAKLTAELASAGDQLKQVWTELIEARQREADADQKAQATVAEIDRIRADLEAAREQRQKAEIRAAAAEAAAEAERKRADAAEQQCKVKDEQAAQQAQTVTALTTSLQTAQEHAKELNTALTAAQALHAGTIQKQLETTADDLDNSTDQQPKKKRWLFGGLFHKGNKDS